jgi:type I restriction enzyme S subunit
MMALDDWKPAKLNELGFVGRGKSRHRPRNASILYGGRYPFFQTGDIKAANFYLTEYSQTYSEEGLAQSKLWNPGTLCITIAANIAESAILGVEGCFPDSVVGFVANPEKADVRFIKYYMEVLKLQMQSVSRGTTQDNLSVDKLLTFDFHVPPLPVQQRIAGILSAYDELIENCHRRIKILEAMVRALYREWFVHFHFPGHENYLRVVSPLGEIPQGWGVKRLGDISSYINRGIAPLYDEEGDTLVINQKCVRDQRLSLEPSRKQSKAIPSEKRVCFGDVLINSTGVGTLGRVAQVYETLGNCTVDTHVTIARASRDIDLDFYGCCLLNLQETFERLGIGATGQTELGKTAISDIELVVPPEKLQRKFGEAVRGMRSAAVAYGKQIQNLHCTRDLLLPRLLSGQIDLGGAEEDVLAKGVALPVPVEALVRPSTSIKAEVTTPKTVPEPENLSRPIGTVERDEVLCAIRKVFGDGVERNRDVALRDITCALGYRRLGPRIREAVSGHLIAAVRRGIVVNVDGNYRLGFRSFADCPRDALKDAFESAIGRAWIVREDAIRGFARWAGFGRVGDVIDQTARSLINGLIREGRVETNGPELIRRT